MAKMDPVIKKETTYVGLWVLAACLLVQGVCLLLGWWSLSVLLGSLLGGVTAVGNFLLMCRMVQKAVLQDPKQAKNTRGCNSTPLISLTSAKNFPCQQSAHISDYSHGLPTASTPRQPQGAGD